MLYMHVKACPQGSIGLSPFAPHQLPIFIFISDQAVFCGSLLARFTESRASPSEQCNPASLEDIEEFLVVFLFLLASRQTLEVSPGLLAIVDRLPQQFGCSEGHGLSLNFADDLEHFGMVIIDKPVPVRLHAIGKPHIEQALKVRFVFGAHVISELSQEALLECELVSVVQSAQFSDQSFVFGGC
jgi:hypothetical protein